MAQQHYCPQQLLAEPEYCLISGFRMRPTPQPEVLQLLELLPQRTLRQTQPSEQFIIIVKYQPQEVVAEQLLLQQQQL